MLGFINHPNFQLVFAIVILIMVLFAAKLAYDLNQPASERLTGLSYSSGASMRFNQEPTATNQTGYQTGYNYEVLNAMPTPVPDAPVPDAEHFSGEYQDQEAILAAQLYDNREHLSANEQVATELATARGFSA